MWWARSFPEIKPGKYTLKDKKKFPFEKVMWKHLYDRFNAPPTSGARHVGNFTEIEIVPTRQYYHSLPVAEATKKYMGTVKQDGQGYIINDTLRGWISLSETGWTPQGPADHLQLG